MTGAQLAGIIIGCLVLLIILCLIALKVYARLTCGVCTSNAKMDGKVVIVTGATSGIGKETAKDMARRGARVILACRNTDEAGKVKDELSRETGNSNIAVKKLDLSHLDSVRSFAADIIKTEPRLDVLIHNAGVAYTFEKVVSKDGLDMTMATNHFGPFLLTHLLIGVTVNCLHPGMIDSGIWRNVPFPLSLLLLPLTKGLFKSPTEGAQTTIHCAVSETLEGVSGKYFMDCKAADLSSGIQDTAIARKCWELSEPLVLKSSDPRL